MYRVQAIILYRQVIRDNHIRTILFTDEYGKITAWEKGATIGDIGSEVEVLIERKNNHNTIKRLDVKQSIEYDNWQYDEVIEHLELMKLLYETLPEGGTMNHVYHLIQSYTHSVTEQVGKVGFIYCTEAICLKQLGYLSLTELPESIRNKIPQNIRSMKSMDINLITDELVILKNILLKTRHEYTHNL